MHLCVSSELGAALRHLRGFCQYIILGLVCLCQERDISSMVSVLVSV